MIGKMIFPRKAAFVRNRVALFSGVEGGFGLGAAAGGVVPVPARATAELARGPQGPRMAQGSSQDGPKIVQRWSKDVRIYPPD